jgi:hypothetical protein
MRFRYFILSGKVKETYDIVEIMQLAQEDARNKFLKANKVERLSTGLDNQVNGLIFEDGVEVPAGFTKPDKHGCVRPKAKGDDAKWWREQLKNLNVKANCDEALREYIKGPSYVLGEAARLGRRYYNIRAGYVGENLIVEIPDPKNEYKKIKGMKEIPAWKFEKLCEELYDYKPTEPHYIMRSRFYDYSQPKVEVKEMTA